MDEFAWRWGRVEGVQGWHGEAAVAGGRLRKRRALVLVLRDVEERGEEEEEAEGDGRDVGGELAAGVDGRAACG